MSAHVVHSPAAEERKVRPGKGFAERLPTLARKAKRRDKGMEKAEMLEEDSVVAELAAELAWFRKTVHEKPGSHFLAATRLAAVVRNVTTNYVSDWLRNIASTPRALAIFENSSHIADELQATAQASQLKEQIVPIADDVVQQVQILKVISEDGSPMAKRQRVLRLQREFAAAARGK